MLRSIQQKVEHSLDIMQSFIDGGYQFENKNIYNVFALMSQEEIKEFACDCRSI